MLRSTWGENCFADVVVDWGMQMVVATDEQLVQAVTSVAWGWREVAMPARAAGCKQGEKEELGTARLRLLLQVLQVQNSPPSQTVQCSAVRPSSCISRPFPPRLLSSRLLCRERTHSRCSAAAALRQALLYQSTLSFTLQQPGQTVHTYGVV